MNPQHAFLLRVRRLIDSLTDRLTDEERSRVNHLIDHGEIGEGLLSLAWIVVNGRKTISTGAYEEFVQLSAGLVEERHLPPNLHDHVDRST
jgi:hypothetical protein